MQKTRCCHLPSVCLSFKEKKKSANHKNKWSPELRGGGRRGERKFPRSLEANHAVIPVPGLPARPVAAGREAAGAQRGRPGGSGRSTRPGPCPAPPAREAPPRALTARPGPFRAPHRPGASPRRQGRPGGVGWGLRRPGEASALW